MPVCCRADLRRHGAVTSKRADRRPGCTTLLASGGHAPAPVATAKGVACAARLAVATVSGGYWPSRPGPGHWMPSCVFA